MYNTDQTHSEIPLTTVQTGENENESQLECFLTVGRNVNHSNRFGKQFGAISYSQDALDPTVPLPGVFSEEAFAPVWQERGP